MPNLIKQKKKNVQNNKKKIIINLVLHTFFIIKADKCFYVDKRGENIFIFDMISGGK